VDRIENLLGKKKEVKLNDHGHKVKMTTYFSALSELDCNERQSWKKLQLPLGLAAPNQQEWSPIAFL
jgi:hypothetical protein